MNYAQFGKEKNYAANPFLLDIHVPRMIEAHRVAGNYMADSALLKSGTLLYMNVFGTDAAKKIAAEIYECPIHDGRTDGNTLTIGDGDTSSNAMGSLWEILRHLFTAQEKMFGQFCTFTYKQHLHNCPDDNDEQKVFHSDTFFPATKFWYFPEKVVDGAFWYVPDSPILTDALIQWHQDRVDDLKDGKAEDWRGQGHKEGSFRISEEELAGLGYKPAPVCVEADTLVVANTFGFHKRGDTKEPEHRVSIHGNLRIKNPFG